MAEGKARRDRVSLPLAAQGLIATLPENEKFAAETRALAFTQAERLNPLVTALAEA